MVDYTTVRIKKESAEKINKMKGVNGSVADVIEKLLGSVGVAVLKMLLKFHEKVSPLH